MCHKLRHCLSNYKDKTVQTMTSQGSMENILSSIRDSVEQETAKVGGHANVADDVLTLSADDMLEVSDDVTAGSDAAAVAEPEDELIDINAFADSGEEKSMAGSSAANGADVLGVDDALPGGAPAEEDVAAGDAPAAEAPAEAAAGEDEFDKLLAELEQDAPAEEPAAAEPAPEPAAEAEPAGEDDMAAAMAAMEGGAPAEEDVEEPTADPVAEEPAAVEEVVADEIVTAVSETVELAAVEGAGGLQVAFPAEVLAAALRPMVKDWVARNLPQIVEKLVREEIGKLGQD